LNLSVRWNFPNPNTVQLNQTHAAANMMISIPTAAAKPAELASVVAVELLTPTQQVDESSSLHAPLHIPLEANTSLFLHEKGSLPVPLWTLKPVLLSVHFALQQMAESAAAQGLPAHLPSEANVVSLPHSLASLVVALFSFQPLEHFAWQQVPASEAAQDEPVQ
jgi:hypothetical protein